MKLINDFENEDIQTVATFNRIFKSTPIVGLPIDLEVQIMEPANADRRWIKVGEDFIRINLTQKADAKGTRKTCADETHITEKACTSCLVVKPMKDFTPHAKSRGGRRSYCKLCCNKESKRRQLIRKQRESNELHNTAE